MATPSSLVVGFDCEFVKPPLVQSECPVCLHVIREPHQVTCCGKRFCQLCIQRVKDTDKACPTCKKEEFFEYPDIGHKQFVYGQSVYCSYRKDGCEWTGELGQLDDHLKTNPRLEKEKISCDFVKVVCIHNCGAKLQRRYIQIHQTELCSKRPFSCEHCHDFDSTFIDVAECHWPVCGSFRVPCPNECGSHPQRQNLDNHVAVECPLAFINCHFHQMGCAVKLIRREMPEHLRESLLTHMSLLATSHVKQQAQIASLITDNDELRSKNTNLEQNLLSHETNFAALQAQVTTLGQENESLNAKSTEQQIEISKLNVDCIRLVAENSHLKTNVFELEPLRQTFKASLPLVCTRHVKLSLPVLVMMDFYQHKHADDNWYSPPVYTHHRGYKICMRVAANGDDSGTGTHVSIYVNFMKGEFDNLLKWPFRGIISIQLLDQDGHKNHKTDSIVYDDTVGDNDCSRVMEGDTNGWGWGKAEFIAHSQLEPKYLKNNTLLFQIFKVELQ